MGTVKQELLQAQKELGVGLLRDHSIQHFPTLLEAMVWPVSFIAGDTHKKKSEEGKGGCMTLLGRGSQVQGSSWAASKNQGRRPG